MKHLIFALLLPTSAVGQGVCADRDAALATLASRYEETQQARGYAPTTTGGFILEIYANTSTGTWTILATQPDGRVCVIAVGGEG